MIPTNSSNLSPCKPSLTKGATPALRLGFGVSMKTRWMLLLQSRTQDGSSDAGSAVENSSPGSEQTVSPREACSTMYLVMGNQILS